MVAYWEIAAHSAYDLTPKYKYLIVNLVSPITAFGMIISSLLRLFLIIAYLTLFSCGTKHTCSYLELQFSKQI